MHNYPIRKISVKSDYSPDQVVALILIFLRTADHSTARKYRTKPERT